MNLILAIAAFFFMEFIAWSNHKYVMHGFLWKWHRDHHTYDHGKKPEEAHKETRYEMNDLFFIVYALPAVVLLFWGFAIHNNPMIYVGFGISAYGLVYFLFHDALIHGRMNVGFLKNTKNKYIRAMVRAHIAHHWPKSKDDFKNYGLLFFNRRYLKE